MHEASSSANMMPKRTPVPFHTFASSFSFSSDFRNNVKDYTRHWADEEDYMPVWRRSLVHDNKILPLYTIEEESSPTTPCYLCRLSGWSNNFVSKRKYHFIIPADREWNKPLNKDALDDKSHLLHGLIHCNGFGHLICINGKEGGSGNLCGREIMDLWDRLCNALQVRKITVEDVIAYGHSFFGRWGYRFSGSFETAEKYYDCAVEELSSVQLDKIHDFSECAIIKQIIDRYRHVSEGRLLTMRDLLRFILTLRTASLSGYAQPKSPPAGKHFSDLAAVITCQWPRPMLEETAEAVVDILKQKKEGAASYEELKDALSGGDTGLLDCVLSLLDDVMVGSNLVKCDTSDDISKPKYSLSKIREDPNYTDVQVVYHKILMTNLLATKVVLESKIFIKEWPVKDRFIGQVKSWQQTGEVIPPSSIIGDLKQVASASASHVDLKVEYEYDGEEMVCSICDKSLRCMSNGGAIYCDKCYDSFLGKGD